MFYYIDVCVVQLTQPNQTGTDDSRQSTAEIVGSVDIEVGYIEQTNRPNIEMWLALDSAMKSRVLSGDGGGAPVQTAVAENSVGWIKILIEIERGVSFIADDDDERSVRRSSPGRERRRIPPPPLLDRQITSTAIPPPARVIRNDPYSSGVSDVWVPKEKILPPPPPVVNPPAVIVSASPRRSDVSVMSSVVTPLQARKVSPPRLPPTWGVSQPGKVIRDWLSGLGLDLITHEETVQRLHCYGVKDLASILSLTEHDMAAMQLPIGVRRKILNAV